MKHLSIATTILLAAMLSGCLSLSHGTFGAASKRKLVAEGAHIGPSVSGADCAEFTFTPDHIPQLNTAYAKAKNAANGEADLFTNASVTINGHVKLIGGGSICDVVRGDPVYLNMEADPGNSGSTREPPEQEGLKVVEVSIDGLGVLSSNAEALSPEILGEPVVGEDCVWSFLFIPLNGFKPDPAAAFEDAIAKAGSSANLLVNGEMRAENGMFVLVNTGCWQVEATPAHSDLIE